MHVFNSKWFEEDPKCYSEAWQGDLKGIWSGNEWKFKGKKNLKNLKARLKVTKENLKWNTNGIQKWIDRDLTAIRNGTEGVRILQKSVGDPNKFEYEGEVDRDPIGV